MRLKEMPVLLHVRPLVLQDFVILRLLLERYSGVVEVAVAADRAPETLYSGLLRVVVSVLMAAGLRAVEAQSSLAVVGAPTEREWREWRTFEILEMTVF